MKKLFTLFAVAVMAFAANAAELTICDGEYYSPSVPIYGLWADTEGTTGQMIYPAEMLEDMVGQDITSLKFYTTAFYYNNYGDPSYIGSSDYINFEGATVQLSLMVVEETGFEAMMEGATVVATVVPVFGEDNMTFELDAPFKYEGGNLFVECKIIATEGDYGTTYFYGAGFDEGTNCCYYGYNGYSGWNESIFDFLPMVTFTYEETEEPPIDPEDPHAQGVWLVVLTQDGEEVWNEMDLTEGNYSFFLELDYDTYGTFAYDAGEDRPDVEMYVVYDGVVLGAPEEGTLVDVVEPENNLLNETENNYILEKALGKIYQMGVYTNADGQKYLVASPMPEFVGVDELLGGKSVAGVRYFNMAGQEMQEANGITIVVTTYTDGTSSAVKVVK